jgi:arylsulfate sulfotransferase
MRCLYLLPLFIVGSLSNLWSKPSVQIRSALTSPQPVGTVVGLTAVPKEEGDPFKTMSKLRFRYSVSVDGAAFRIVRDFAPSIAFAWRPELYEHESRVKVTILNVESKETGEAELPFRIVSRVAGATPLATPTASPLVALFSFSACPAGSRFRVAFQLQGDAEIRRTGLEPCRGLRSSNMYVAGMRADSLYNLHSEVLTNDRVESGPAVAFRTGIADGNVAAFTTGLPNGKPNPAEPFLIYSIEVPRSRPMATDTDGNLVWYLPEQDQNLTRMLSGGRFLTFSGGINPENSRAQVVREVDLVGNVVRETNIYRIAEQIESSYGIQSVCKPNGGQCISGFHHDAIRLPNGHTVAIVSLERMFPKGGQGSNDPVNIVGTILVDLDEDFQVKWIWNSFDHLDVKRAPLGDEKCNGPVGGGGCSAIFLTPTANDWLHANALAYSRADGNLLLSMPEQDWVIKIDYSNGKGAGKVLWRMGEGGDLKTDSKDAYPWFSYQHDAGYEPAGSDTVLLLDNGQRHKKKDPKANTRGQLWKIDEKARTASLVMNVDLGVFSPFVGSAQRLSNGNYHFTAGALLTDTSFGGKSFEINADGKIVYVLELTGAMMYRSNRITDLYTPPGR